MFPGHLWKLSMIYFSFPLKETHKLNTKGGKKKFVFVKTRQGVRGRAVLLNTHTCERRWNPCRIPGLPWQLITNVQKTFCLCKWACVFSWKIEREGELGVGGWGGALILFCFCMCVYVFLCVTHPMCTGAAWFRLTAAVVSGGFQTESSAVREGEKQK